LESDRFNDGDRFERMQVWRERIKSER